MSSTVRKIVFALVLLGGLVLQGVVVAIAWRQRAPEKPRATKDIPDKFHVSFIALLPRRKLEDPKVLTAAIQRLRPGLRSEDDWSAELQPRRVVFGHVRDGEWVWLLAHDLDPMPESVRRLASPPGIDLPPSESEINVYLTAWPNGASALDQVRATLEVARALGDSGANALLCPGGRTVIAETSLVRLRSMSPERLSTAELARMLVSYTDFGPGADGRVRLGTTGLVQFLQPEIGCSVSAERSADDQREVTEFLDAAVPLLMERRQPLQRGERIVVAGQTWEAVERTGVVQLMHRVE